MGIRVTREITIRIRRCESAFSFNKSEKTVPSDAATTLDKFLNYWRLLPHSWHESQYFAAWKEKTCYSSGILCDMGTRFRFSQNASRIRIPLFQSQISLKSQKYDKIKKPFEIKFFMKKFCERTMPFVYIPNKELFCWIWFHFKSKELWLNLPVHVWGAKPLRH